MRMITTLAIAVIGAGLTATPVFAQAAKKMTADLSGKQEVPPNDTKGSGKAEFTYDAATKKLTWKISTMGLTGDAIAAHIHGPAEAGANAGVLVNLAPDGIKNPLEGTATLTDEQAAALLAGKAYVNVHTPTNKGGEIRAQIKP